MHWLHIQSNVQKQSRLKDFGAFMLCLAAVLGVCWIIGNALYNPAFLDIWGYR